MTALTSRTSTARFGETGPSEAQLADILEAAQRAPDHGRLRPWRFVIVEGEARQKFGELLATSLRRREPAASEQTLEAEQKKAFRAPMIVVVAAEVQQHPKIPEIEQVLAAGAAAQNILLAAHALGFGATWKTGGAAYDASIKSALGFSPKSQVVAFIYIGSVAVPGRFPPEDRSNVIRHWPRES
jgi:nitroreductase